MTRQNKPTYSQTPGVKLYPTGRTELTQSFGPSPKVPGRVLTQGASAGTGGSNGASPAAPGSGTGGGSGTGTAAYPSITQSASSGFFINGLAADTRGGPSPAFAYTFLVTGSLLKGDGAGGIAEAAEGTDYSAPWTIDGVDSVGSPLSFSSVSHLSLDGAGGYLTADPGDGHPRLMLLGGTGGGGASGTVTSISVTVPGGFAVTPSTITTAGTFVISTALSGIIKGTGTGFVAAVAGTDYGLGSVTSVSGAGGGTGLTLSGGPITGAGTLTLGGTLAIASGGTNATSASAALANLGGAPLTRSLSAGTGLSGGGDLSADRSFSLANTAVTAGSYTNANITVDAQGRITAAANGSTGGGGAGTVTSVSLTAPTGFSVSGSPVTSAGTLALTTTLSGIIKGTGSGFVAATAGTDYVVPARAINTGTGLSGGGNLSADRTISLANTAVTAGSYTNANLTVDAQGRLTAASNGSGGGGSIPAGSTNQTLRYSATNTLSATSFLSNDGSTVTINPAGDAGAHGDGVTRFYLKGSSPSVSGQYLAVFGDDNTHGNGMPVIPFITGPCVITKSGIDEATGTVGHLYTDNGYAGLFVGLVKAAGSGNEHYYIGSPNDAIRPLLLQRYGGKVGIGFIGTDATPRLPTEQLEVYGNVLTDGYKVYDGGTPTAGFTGDIPPGSTIHVVGGIITGFS